MPSLIDEKEVYLLLKKFSEEMDMQVDVSGAVSQQAVLAWVMGGAFPELDCEQDRLDFKRAISRLRVMYPEIALEFAPKESEGGPDHRLD